jgi:hypothetical protein
MGLNSGTQVLYSLKCIYVGDVVDICKGIASDWKMEMPTIDVDCSNVCLRVGKNVPSVVSLLLKWANTVLKVVLVCDSKVRSISKQASIKRKADRDKNHIRAAHIH